jgi:RNA polymerase sigma-70 factor (ECF subfamily)
MKTSTTTRTNKEFEASLVTAAKLGDPRAFEELVARHERRAFATAHRITGNREDAEDVVQESFHKAFRHLATFQEKARFSSWLTRIVMNEAYMLLRQRRRMMEVLPQNPEEAESAPDPFVDRSPSPEESYWRRERKELLTKAVNRLRPTIREAILARDLEERSVEETAHLLGTSPGAVKARLFHARRMLRRRLNPELLHDLPSLFGSSQITIGV